MRLFISAAVAALAFAGAASAQDAKPASAPAKGQYISLAGGYIGKTDYDYGVAGGRVEADLDASAQFAAAWGVSLDKNLRAELAVGYRSQDIETTVRAGALSQTFDADKAQTLSLDFNAYYDFPVAGPVKPYVGAGIGAASVKIDDGVLDDTGSALTLQAIAGASVEVSPRIALFAEARYQRVGPIRVETTTPVGDRKSKFDLSSAGALVGVRFGF
ncbi:outer membrane beta-barrel protein [Caulobacter sp. 602-2]|uniref:Outer membrane beta-barrel protein n=1 Tax=Caulobacter sp. 602-2 TaxID=2710887 RepID=A0A6G4QV01_9CAUL|nr:outer membrane beta-barrel protein [Caulobacter sp. 602-2]NGM49450.1 outer membrane beta-barrel protein [Caulobacter sp. 602-2]